MSVREQLVSRTARGPKVSTSVRCSWPLGSGPSVPFSDAPTTIAIFEASGSGAFGTSLTSMGTSGFGRSTPNATGVLSFATILVARRTSLGSTGWLNLTSNACFGVRCVAPSPGVTWTTRGPGVSNVKE